MAGAFYNDNDRHSAAWLKELVKRGHLAAGVVDDCSISDICPSDLFGYEQCHFFAGVGGWPYALALAGWSGPVWTGSCPCQPFSAAGKQLGTADERHLWPEFRRLIAECRPPTIFGEQVASKLGREWLDGVRADLEALGYAVGAADLCAASVGAPHIRQRLFWVADARHRPARLFGECGAPIGKGIGGNGAAGGMGDTESEQVGRAGQSWQDSVWLPCLDGKARRIEPGVFPLAHGVPARVGRLRGYGNAIVPQVAAVFVRAFMDR